MNEQPEKENLRESGRGNSKFWFPKWWAYFSSPPVVLVEILAIAIGLCYWATQTPEYNPFGIVWVFYLSCCGTLSLLLAIFSAVTRGWKVYVVVFLLLLLVGFASMVPFSNSNEGTIFFLLPLLIAIPIQVVVEGIHYLYGTTFTQSEAPDLTSARRLRFKTRDLFIITTLIAVGIVIVQPLALYMPGRIYDSLFMMVVLIAVLVGVNAFVSVWAILGQTDGVRIVESSISAIAFLLVFLLVLNHCVRSIQTNEILMCMFFTVLSWGSSTVQLCLFRGEGYRFVRNAK